MECILEGRLDISREGIDDIKTQTNGDCIVDCWGQIIISVGVGVLAGAVVVVVGRWGIRYAVMENWK